MQNRYAGDLGDLLKLGLLRWLVAPTDGRQALSLGVNWYLTPDEAHNADGKHIAYLSADHRDSDHLRGMDPALYDGLHAMVSSGVRSVSGLESVLPPDTLMYGRELRFDDLAPTCRADRIARRDQWHEAALAALAGTDLVFLDPDNGIRPSTHPIPRHRNKAEKHAYLDEVVDYASRGQSVVVYHHADRSEPVPAQARRRLEMLSMAVPAPPLACVRASRGTTRLFIIAPAPRDAARLTSRLHALSESPWAGELRLFWFRDGLV